MSSTAWILSCCLLPYYMSMCLNHKQDFLTIRENDFLGQVEQCSNPTYSCAKRMHILILSDSEFWQLTFKDLLSRPYVFQSIKSQTIQYSTFPTCLSSYMVYLLFISWSFPCIMLDLLLLLVLYFTHTFFFIFYTYLNNNKKSFHFLVVNLVNPAHYPGENTAFSLIKAQWIITPARLN